MSYQTQIQDLMREVFVVDLAVDAETYDSAAPGIEVPKKKEMGDFAFACFKFAKVLRKAPNAIAADALAALQPRLKDHPQFAEVAAAGPYLNFKMNQASLAADVVPAVLDGSFLAPRSRNGQKMMIEYSQPNTHKAFHVGHMRNVALGDALARICDWQGYEVVPVNYIGDEGTHIAKCLWFYKNHFDGEVPEVNRGEFLGSLYTQATLMLDPTTLTTYPLAGIYAAQVVRIEMHPSREDQTVVALDLGDREVQVVCGGTGFSVGDRVAFAAPGSRIGGRLVQPTDKGGVASEGMICSARELTIGDDHTRIHVLPTDTPLGAELIEHFRIEGALPEGQGVGAELARRNREVSEVLKALEAKEGPLYDLWQETKQWSMDEFYEIYKWLDARFDHYFFESDVSESGKQAVLEYLEKGVLVRSEGAIGADLSDFGLPFALLLKSDGTGLYATKDISLAQIKFETFGVDKSVYVVDHSQSLHFQQVFRVLEMMGYEKAKDCFHLAYGLVKVVEGKNEAGQSNVVKMSSRKGNVFLFSQLRQALRDETFERYLKPFVGEWSDEEIEEAARWVSVATIRYGMLNTDNLNEIAFDLDAWINNTGNTGSYLMYAYARTRSIKRKLGEQDGSLADWALLTHEAEKRLLSGMSKFHEVVARAAEDFKPNVVCTYLYSLAKDYSRFFSECPIKQAESEALRVTRAQLNDAFGLLLGKGLALLGIRTLERI
ncbi:arginine--tRNA ligase domain-containing protein [Acanthopleuribacter pedis]|uniref:Arginine--tRNA ligase n=1 Tax=Acanthopleuribacter pedis TaxID=442870 RepID=A0A8J7QCR8_9BACT|nr:arginine--tRNA ligase [Acanthopleuribacter pedis]MBO1317180.1 arginine--tRNA ligase [Acanthopleuribacter pedis]